MTSLGIKLRSQRERLGLTVSDVAIQTKIRESYLVAIENDHLDEIPGGFFSRSFVRQYARALGLKQSEIESDLDAVIAKPEDNIQVERILTDYRPTQITRDEALPIPIMNIPQTQLVSVPDQICEFGIGSVPWFKDGRQKGQERDSRCVQISRWPMGNPSISALIARMEPQHEKQADEHMRTEQPGNLPR